MDNTEKEINVLDYFRQDVDNDSDQPFKVYNPFDTDHPVEWGGSVKYVVKAKSSEVMPKYLAKKAAEELVNQLILAKEKSPQIDPISKQTVYATAYEKINDQGVRDKYRVMVFFPYESEPSEVRFAEHETLDAPASTEAESGFTGLNSNDESDSDGKDARADELASWSADDLKDRAGELGINVKGIKRKVDLVSAIVEAEYK